MEKGFKDISREIEQVCRPFDYNDCTHCFIQMVTCWDQFGPILAPSELESDTGTPDTEASLSDVEDTLVRRPHTLHSMSYNL